MTNIKNRLRGKVTTAELEKIQQQQNKVNSILMELGYLESKKHSHLHQLADANVVIDGTKKDLQDKYGHIDINLTTGEWKRNEDVSDKKD